MSLKSKPLVVEEDSQSLLMPLESTLIKGEVLAPLTSKVPCWCLGRKGKAHTVGEPFCYFPVTYLPPNTESKTGVIGTGNLGSESRNVASQLEVQPSIINLTKSPITFDEELLMACINRAIMKTPSDFVTMLDEGRVNFVQARRINNELRLMGYSVTEDPF